MTNHLGENFVIANKKFVISKKRFAISEKTFVIPKKSLVIPSEARNPCFYRPSRNRRRLAASILLLLLTIAAPRSHAATNYTIALTDPGRHLLEIQIILPEGPAQRELQLPVWNALYQIRDFSQYVNWVRAKDRAGHPLSIHSLNPSLWQIEGAQNGAIVEYEVFADTNTPFGAQLNSHHAFFNLAEVLMYPVDLRNQPMTVRFAQLPEKWRIATPLASATDGHFRAENYDRLVDSPVEIGTFAESDFEESSAHYRVIVDAESADYDMQKITAMLRRIVVAATSWMNDRPFETYTFIYHFPHGPAGGGMEHAYSTAISLNADMLARAPEALASVTAHEFFHLWNVKRIRPQSLEPIDYTRENYTRALWFSEGCTSTAADFIQLRAGLLDEPHFEQDLSGGITELERRPAHLAQSAEDSSLDAWLEGNAYYRRPQRSISYYNKGELLCIALDLNLRDATHGHASLRDVFQWMNDNYAKKGKFFPDSAGVREAAEAASHADLAAFFAKYVAGTEEIPWNDFFRAVGLRVVESANTVADGGFAASRNFDGPLTVSAVNAGSEAERAGLESGDVIEEINGHMPGQDSAQEMAQFSPGDTITLKIRRRSAERELKFKLGSREEISYELKDLDTITPTQRAQRALWLKGQSESP
jgi:predicted metalloprotease with PDZ domain